LYFCTESAGRVDRVDVELMRFLRQNAGGGAAPRQRIDEGDLYVGSGRCSKAGDREAQRDDAAGATVHGSSLGSRGGARAACRTAGFLDGC
jgi:hypothetical protein